MNASKLLKREQVLQLMLIAGGWESYMVEDFDEYDIEMHYADNEKWDNQEVANIFGSFLNDLIRNDTITVNLDGLE